MYTCFYINTSLHFSGINAQKYNFCVLCSLHIYFLKKLPNCFPEYLYHFTFSPEIWMVQFLYIFTSTKVTNFYFSHSSRCVVVSHCGFDLHFLTVNIFSRLFVIFVSSLWMYLHIFYPSNFIVYLFFLFLSFASLLISNSNFLIVYWTQIDFCVFTMYLVTLQ